MKKSLNLAGLLLTAFALQSCVDKSYDLDSIDRTIGNSAELTLPLSSTGDIVLRNIMDFDENDPDNVIKFVKDKSGNEIFCVMKSGKAEIEPIHIEPISFAPTLDEISTRINVGTASPASSPARNKIQRRIHIDGIPFEISDDIFDKDFTYEITPESGAQTEIKTEPVSVTCDVRELSHIGLNEQFTLTLNLNIDKRAQLYPWLKYIHFNNAVLVIPEELEIDDTDNYARCTFNGKSIQGVVRDDEGNDSIFLTGDDSGPIDISQTIEMKLTFKGIRNTDANLHFRPNPNPAKDGEIQLDGKFNVTGTFVLKARDVIDYAEAEFDYWLKNQALSIAEKIVEDGSLESIVPKYVDIKGIASFDNGSIDILSVSGKVRHDIGSIEPIMLDDMPDFLNDPDVVLDLVNPAIYLKATNEMPAKATTNISLTSKTDNDTHSVKAPIIIKSEGESLFYLADAEADFKPEGYNAAERLPLDQTYSEDNVLSLIKKIPDQISVGIDAVELEAKDLQMDHDYEVGIEYEVFAPLIMGKDFKLIYVGDPETGISEDLEDLDDLDLGYLELDAKVYNDVPADITLEITPIDKNGNKIKELDVNSIKIKAGANGTPIETFHIKPATVNGKKYTMNDVIAGKNGAAQLDGIKYKAIIDNPNPGIAVPKNAKIKLSDIKITIKGGITYDANDDDD